MKKSLPILLLVLVSNFIIAQNLVPNPSFETFTLCPDNYDQVHLASPWNNPTGASPDYFNGCFTSGTPSVDVPSNFIGQQSARTGTGYAGIITSNYSAALPAAEREYIQVQLTTPLSAGVTYNVQFYWSLADLSSAYVHELGVYFSNTQVNSNDFLNLPYTPQVEQTGSPLNDMNNWIAFNKNYTAVGGEEYIVIGNFNGLSGTTTGSTLVPCSPPQFPICQAYYYIDDVSVSSANGVDEHGFINFNYYPNPTKGNISVEFDEVKNDIVAIITNSLGQTIMNQQYNSIKKINLNMEEAPIGIYFLRLETEDGKIAIRKIIKE